MIKLKEVVIVEGRYDKIRLSSVIDGLIIETGGFRIFKDKEKVAFIRRMAQTRGVLILTDSDAAGFLIRNHLSGILPPQQVKHAYIPDIFGKERRKEKPSKEGKLGVEGVSQQVLLAAIRQAGVCCEEEEAAPQEKRPITKLDLYEAGLSGREDSAARRAAFLQACALPEHLSVNALVRVLNALMDYSTFVQTVEQLDKPAKKDKNPEESN